MTLRPYAIVALTGLTYSANGTDSLRGQVSWSSSSGSCSSSRHPPSGHFSLQVAYDHGISRNYSFFTLSILCIAPFITTFTLYPKRTIPLELGEDEGAPLVSSTTVSNATAQAKYQATTSPNTDTRYYKPTASKTGEILHDNTVSYSDGYSKTISDNNSSFKGGKQQPYFSKASTGGSDRWSEIHFDPSTSLLRSYASSISTHKEDEEENTKETNLSLRHYLSSSTFLLHNAWYVIMSLRWGYFVGNVNPWLHTLTTETAEGECGLIGEYVYKRVGTD